MGYLLKEALKTLCGVNQWSYAVFWKIGCQNPKLLIWEECYYEPVIYSNAAHGVQDWNKIDLLVTKMMKDNYINLLGEGLVGRAAFTRNHQWIISDNKMLGVHPPEVSNEVYMQFSAGIKKIAVIPVNPHGVVQLGSSLTIMENVGFVNDVKSLISQLGCVPGALFSENYTNYEGALNTGPNQREPIRLGNSVSSHSSGKSKVTECMEFTSKGCNQPGRSLQASGSSGHNSFLTNYDPIRSTDQPVLSGPYLGDRVHGRQPNQASETQMMEPDPFQALPMSEEACLKHQSRDDLFDIVGMDLKRDLFSKSRNNEGSGLELQGSVSGLFPVNEGESGNGFYSSTGNDHLLDAVVSKVHSSSKQIDVKTSISSIWANQGIDVTRGDSVGIPESLKKTALTGSYWGNISDTSSIISSEISSRAGMRKTSDLASEHVKKGDEISKSGRKRLKAGENPRPRPKDRQMIQDRVKELREIVPNGAKCSIDALLERTIKHMLFLQSVTKHADKLKQTGESKIVGKDGGLLLRDNFEGGATWAYEVGSQSMVCPIIVEDLSSPRQMLVEMLCEERGSFLEIADVIKGLGLTILKGVMESRNDKIWAHFTVEANRDVTRMEIFISLVSLFDGTVKTGGAAAGQSFHRVTAAPTVG